MTEIHLLVCLHGLWGNIEHLKSMNDAIKERFNKCKEGEPRLEVLLAATNSETLTYDGIDLCAERTVREIDEIISKFEDDGTSKVTRFSIVGYSLGGLIARYIIGILHARRPSFFTKHKPVNFTTFASPAVGIPKYPGFGPGLFYFLGARLLSRSGAQMYATDDFRDGKPLIEVLAEPNTSFVKALNAFEKVTIYANALNDRTVPYPTAGLTSDDPFAKAMRRTNKARSKRQAEPEEPIDIREGGLAVETEADAPIIISFDPIEPVIKSEADISADGQPTASTVSRKRRKRWLTLPPYFYPSFYVFLPKPMRYAIVFGWPIVIPAIFGLIICRFVVQGHSSRRRIKALLTGDLESPEARLRRVGFSDVLDEMIEEETLQGPDTSATPDGSRTGSPVPLEIDGGQEKTKLKTADTSQPIFSQAQLNAISNLTNKSKIPKLEIVLVFLPDSRNAHGTMICRSPAFMDHVKGLPILKHWADRFVM